MASRFQCSKCGGGSFKTGQMRAAGGFWSKIFDVQGRKFTTICCDRCGFTELYQGDTRTLSNVLDFLTQ